MGLWGLGGAILGVDGREFIGAVQASAAQPGSLGRPLGCSLGGAVVPTMAACLTSGRSKGVFITRAQGYTKQR